MSLQFSSPSEALSLIESGDSVFVHGAAATPNRLLRSLEDEAGRLTDVEMIHLHTEGPARYAQPEFAKSFKVTNLFLGANVRRLIDYDRVDYLPCFLSEIPWLFESGTRPLDVAIIHVSPPDRFGHCNLGVSVDVARAAVRAAKKVIAQVNPRMPKVHGDGFVSIKDIDRAVEVDDPLPEQKPKPPTEEELAIARNVASLIEDGSTLQMGIGAIPNAVAGELIHHKNLGIHTEMWSDGVLKLIKSGAVDNSRKKVHAGKTVSTFILGSRDVYDFIHDNPEVIQLEVDYVNNPAVIARNPKVVAINSAVEVDLSGQVCADSIGPRIISGVGGQMDFMRGAAMSAGGKPIIAMTSTTKSGESKIVGTLREGAGVVTTRAHIRFVVTEYGIADLTGKTVGERAKALIEIAHPKWRDELRRSFWCSGG